jgi:hypothetical protein
MAGAAARFPPGRATLLLLLLLLKGRGKTSDTACFKKAKVCTRFTNGKYVV